MAGRGYGKSIVRHLIDEAALLAITSHACCDTLFLDVYIDNFIAINLYKRFGFVNVKEEPIPDPKEDDGPFFVMARRLPAIPV